MANKRKHFLTYEKLRDVAVVSKSIRDVMIRLGIRGGSYSPVLKKMLRDFGIDTSHFLGKGANKGAWHKGGLKNKTPEQLLICRDDGVRESHRNLKRVLIEIGIEYCCEQCKIGPSWNNRPLVIQVDHINGDPFDNRKENLRFLCPNCHSQTDTFTSKNLKSKVEKNDVKKFQA